MVAHRLRPHALHRKVAVLPRAAIPAWLVGVSATMPPGFEPADGLVTSVTEGVALVEIEVLGIGDAFTSRHYNTSFLVRAQRLYLVDAPQALFRLLRERDIDPAAVDNVIITHIHGDHSSGLQTLLLWKKYVQGMVVTLHTSRPVYEQLRDRFFPAFADAFTEDLLGTTTSRFEDYVNFAELRCDSATSLETGLDVEIRENWHPIPTLGLKFRGPRRAVAISGDTCYRPLLLRQLLDGGKISADCFERLAGDWLWDADVIYHEVSRDEPTLHTLERDLLALPEGIRRKIRLVHVADDFVEQDLAVGREGEVVPL